MMDTKNSTGSITKNKIDGGSWRPQANDY